jgi:hypothetical protein
MPDALARALLPSSGVVDIPRSERMSELDISAALVDLLARLEPDVRGATFSVDADLQEALELDDDDLEQFAVAVGKAFGVRVGRHERGLLRSLSGAIAFVRRAQRAAVDGLDALARSGGAGFDDIADGRVTQLRRGR